MNVLLLSRYDRLGASSRLRSLQFLPWLSANGIHITVNAFLPDSYVRDLYEGHRNYRYALQAYLSRFMALRNRHAFDVMWIEKELFPWLPFWLEDVFLNGPPAILDFDDAIFHNYDLNSSWVIRRVLGKKIDRLMARVHTVVVGNSYLASRASEAGAKRIEYIPTVVDDEKYRARPRHNDSACVIGWIGTPITAAYLHELGDALTVLAKSERVRFVLIGSGPISFVGIPTEIHSWFEETEQEKITLFDVGVMPLIDAPWERGKCGYKLIQYMAAGIPVVASPVGANIDIVDHGVNGYLARSKDEWLHFLRLLVRDPELRQSMGKAGRSKVEQRYSLKMAAPKLAQVMRTAASMKTKG